MLVDTLEGRSESGVEDAGKNNEEAVAALLKEFGPPQKVAASYAPQGQYLVGPELYPLFRMIAGIALAAVIGAQLLALGIGVWVGDQSIQPWETLVGLLNSIPATLGSLVIVFAILQWLDVHPEVEAEPWDPSSLPEIDEFEEVKRGERIFGIAAGSVLLAILAIFPEKIGVWRFPEGEFLANPVILQYLGWISLSLLAGIGLDIYLLWQGRWTIASRFARLAVNLLSITVLALLLQGHNTWLAQHGAGDIFSSLQESVENVNSNWLLIGMQAFRLAFGIALVVTCLETAGQIYRLLRSFWRGSETPGVLRLRE